MNKFYYLIILISCLYFHSCDIINPEEEIPAFIQFENFDLSVSGGQGNNFERITEGWAYVNGDLIGAFTEGKPFPVLHDGTAELIVDPGIHTNAISALTQLYPLYSRFTAEVELIKGEVTTVTPQFNYIDESVFVFVEEFNDTHIFSIDRDLNENTFMDTTSVGTLNGTAGVIRLDNDNALVELATAFSFSELPADNINSTFLEISYKTDIRFEIGMISTDQYGLQQAFYSHGLNAKDDWNKAYLDLTQLLLSVEADTYQVAFRAVLPSDLTEAFIYLDDIKLVHSDY